MLESGINISVAKPPTQQLIVEWVIKEFDSISVDTVQHSWRHGVYSWFNYINKVFICSTFLFEINNVFAVHFIAK